jgi:hypothetical protein
MESWWLKVKRAQKHMVDIERDARRYASLQPYRFEPFRQPKGHRDLRWTLRITSQPDPMLALMVGDFVHNLRSALDHVVVASIPRKARSNFTSFPWTSVDIFAKRANGEFVIKNDSARQEFERAIRGIHPNARAVIIRLQPYHAGTEAHRMVLGLISRLDNADKHRELTTFGAGLLNLWAEATYRGTTIQIRRHNLGDWHFADDGTVIGWRDPSDPAVRPEDVIKPEVHMEFGGTATIFVRMTRMDGKKATSSFRLEPTMVRAIRTVRWALRMLEPFALYKA